MLKFASSASLQNLHASINLLGAGRVALIASCTFMLVILAVWQSAQSTPSRFYLSAGGRAMSAEPYRYWRRPLKTEIFNSDRAQDACSLTGMECLDWAQKDLFSKGDLLSSGNNSQLAVSTTGIHLTHTFWKGEPGRYLRLLVLSWLYTQRLSTSRLYIWVLGYTDAEIALSLRRPEWEDLLNQAGSILEFRAYDPEQLKPDQGDIHFDTSKLVPMVAADMARFLVLYRFGGLYLDADTIVLRDMSPMINLPIAWAYSWSCQNYANTAVLSIPSSTHLVEGVISSAVRNGMNFHPAAITEYMGEDLLQFNSVLFDSAWKYGDGCDPWPTDFPPERLSHGNHRMITVSYPHTKAHMFFFPGCYTFHYHLSNQPPETDIPDDSWFSSLEGQYLRFLLDGEVNAYGERFERV